YIERIIRKFKGGAADNNMELELNQELVEETAQIDPDKIEQVCTNLIDKAIKHTNESGVERIDVKNNEDGFNVAIQDSGSGIPEEDLLFVFERFYKADKSRVRNKEQKGTGLGLAIAKNIIDTHHGTITVKSKLNQGTTFNFTIPHK